MPDLRFAAWFLWMTPLLAALSSALLAVANAVAAASASPASAAVRNRRTAVFRADLTATLRCRRRSLVLIRLIWDLMFATREPRCLAGGVLLTVRPGGMRTRTGLPRYQRREPDPNPGRACDSPHPAAVARRRSRPWDDGSTVTTPAATDPARIRNFCIIAHIDHGKSTLADRMLEVTGIVEGRQMRAQYLDRMDIERERGITIKAQNVRLPWTPRSGEHEGTPHVLHMIDTPGHVDFTYEVSRSLAACEGAVLLVDAAQGIEAQTLANLYLALENDLTIIPVLNKIDLPAAQPEKYAAELAHIIGCDPSEVLRVSGKTGEGVPELLDAIVTQIPAPTGEAEAPARAMIFDSVYDIYRGVITYVRVVDGRISARDKIKMMSTGATHELLEIGVISPEPKPVDSLGVGEVGYFITGVKDVRQSRVGDTVTLQNKPAT